MKKTILLYILFLCSTLSYGQISDLNLMPWPQEIEIGKNKLVINAHFTIKINQKSSERIDLATTQFLRRLTDKTGVFLNNGFATSESKIENPTVEVNYTSIAKLKLYEDESYQLNVTKNKISITANTDIGVAHAFSTLFQLITNDANSYYIPEVSISDFPRFAWRGLMIDCSRHFMPIDVLKRNIDAMASVKMNIFHWHLTDDQGIRIESKIYPKLHKLGSDGLYYTQDQIKDLVQYASARGIHVLPEIDVPGHATAFVTAIPEISSIPGAYSIERNAGVFDPTLDPTNEKTYEILTNLFGEVTALFPFPYFHIGGDENEGKHWDESEHIQQFMKENGLKTNHDLQTYFNIRLQKILKKENKTLMGWDEIMTDEMPKDAMIHSWRGENEGFKEGGTQIKAAKLGFKTVLSNGYYIDRMQPASEHYLVDPLSTATLTLEEEKRIVGGEATMWSELITPLTIDSRIWPRTVAIAERFWSAKEVTDVNNMYERLNVVNNNLEYIGITHIRNKDVILRNISNYQDTDALEKLSNISEPLKVYSRNVNGIEYQMYSPFSLFADACTADASDTKIFNNLVSNYISKKDEASKDMLIDYFNSLKNIETELQKISNNAPLVKRVLPYANRVSKIASIFEVALTNKNMSKKQYGELIELLDKKEDPAINLDVELALTASLKKLATSF
ncbi:MAG: family 20 glycosylhydrolase [Urechidicola sp.]|nr:family 20 glycosylhydrolase [Urechidicola sp.]